MLALSFAALAAGAKWSPGGDVGHSGNQPLSRGLPPYEPMWSLPLPEGHRIATPLLITNGGPGPRAPRLVFGTDDGTVHLFDLYTGSRVGEVRLNNSGVPYSFSGFGGFVGLTDSSTEAGLGQIFAVYNDANQVPSVEPDSTATYEDDIAVAQIDAESGRLIIDMPVPGTPDFRVSSSPVLSEPDGAGDRQLVFSAVNRDSWQYDYEHPPEPGLDQLDPTGILFPPAPTVQNQLVRIPIKGARNVTATTDLGNLETTSVGKLNPMSAPGLIYLTDVSTAKPPAPSIFALVPTADNADPLQTRDLSDFTVSGPSSGRLDPQAGGLVFAQAAAVPVTAAGLPPGSPDSKAARAPTLYVAAFRPDINRTIVHRLVPNAAGDAFVEAARSAGFSGPPVGHLAVSGAAGQAGGTAGRVVLATERNLYALKGGDLSMAWRLEPGEPLRGGADGFTRSAPTVTGGVVLIARDNGQPLAIDLQTGKRLGEDRLRLDAAHAASGLAAPGAPASANGVVVFASDQGVFAYRNSCGNVMKGSNQNEALEGTLAGDDIASLGGVDTVTAGPGADCVTAGDGDDVVDSGDGADDVKGGTGDDRLLGGEGDDRLSGETGFDTLLGEAGNDVLEGGLGEDIVKGANGDDRIAGGPEADRLYGNGDADRITGDGGADRIKGNIGDDSLFGGAGADIVDGGAGNDVLDGGRGADQLFGRDGDDRINAADGFRDQVSCGSGKDAATVDTRDIVRGCETVVVKKPAKRKAKRKAKRRAKRKAPR